jgi:hypothetical protein
MSKAIISTIDVSKVLGFVKDKSFEQLNVTNEQAIVVPTEEMIIEPTEEVITTLTEEMIIEPTEEVITMLTKETTTNNDIIIKNGYGECGDLFLVVSNKENDISEDYKQFNGVIFEKDTNKVVGMCQNKLKDLNSIDEARVLITENIDKRIRVEYCEDGTIMRLYNYKNKWYTATTRCVNANRSYWTSSKNFDELFWECFNPDLLESLDKTFTYVFILLHKENRIVVKHNVNMLVYISRINNTTFEEDFVNVFYNEYGIRRTKKIDSKNMNYFFDNFSSFNHPYKRGILIKIYDNVKLQWDVYKLDFEKYQEIKSLRGNIPEIRMRYIELLNSPKELQLFQKYYGENYYMFTIIKKSLYELVKNVYSLYVESHIKHNVQVKDDDIFYKTLRQLHAQYKTTNKNISYIDVQNKIYSLDKFVIRKLLRWNEK